MGCVYKPKKSPYWWIKFYVNGKPQYESTKTEKKKVAEQVLKDREGRVVNGQPLLPRVDRIRYEEAEKDLKRHYQTTGCRALDEVEPRLKRLTSYFAGRRIVTIGPADATAYVEKRQAAGAANATINRELAVLGRMLRLAYENGKLVRVPVLRKVKEAPPRQGFFERDQYEAVREHLPPDLRLAVAIEYEFGWRCQSEVLALELRQVDLDAGTIRLDAGQTKNDEGRVVYVPEGLKAEIKAQVERVRELERKTERIIPHLFPHAANGRRHKKGDRIRDFRKAWASACIAAGFYRAVGVDPKTKAEIKVPTMLRHDFRRTAVRDLVNAGVPERVAMKITGHKTRAVFDRYHIVSPGDLQEAVRKREAARVATVRNTVIPITARSLEPLLTT